MVHIKWLDISSKLYCCRCMITLDIVFSYNKPIIFLWEKRSFAVRSVGSSLVIKVCYGILFLIKDLSYQFIFDMLFEWVVLTCQFDDPWSCGLGSRVGRLDRLGSLVQDKVWMTNIMDWLWSRVWSQSWTQKFSLHFGLKWIMGTPTKLLLNISYIGSSNCSESRASP